MKADIRFVDNGTSTDVIIKILIDHTHKDDHRCIINSLNYTKDWLLKHLLWFRPWDYKNNIRLFADSLEQTGKFMCDMESGNRIKTKNSYRALAAARMLKQAYVETLPDKSTEMIQNKIKSQLIGTEINDVVQFLNTNYVGVDKAKVCGILEAARRRVSKARQNNQKFVWQFIARHIQHFFVV